MHNHIHSPHEGGFHSGELMVTLDSTLELLPRDSPAVRDEELATRLQHFQKIEALGRAALGVAHEFNNLLSVVTGYAELLQVNPSLDVPAREALAGVRQAADRAASLAQQLLHFGRRPTAAPAVTDLGDVVASVRQLLKCVLGSAIRLTIVPSPGPCPIQVSPGQVEQVLLNLVVNARDALEGTTALTALAQLSGTGAQVMVATGTLRMEQDYHHAHGMVPAGAYGWLVVNDNGCGMDATTQARLFEPFFTTKEPGKGTGLGMAIIAAILKESDGYITLWSERGRGSRFEVYWPLMPMTNDQ